MKDLVSFSFRHLFSIRRFHQLSEGFSVVFLLIQQCAQVVLGSQIRIIFSYSIPIIYLSLGRFITFQ